MGRPSLAGKFLINFSGAKIFGGDFAIRVENSSRCRIEIQTKDSYAKKSA
jgi:hypothetical protein